MHVALYKYLLIFFLWILLAQVSSWYFVFLFLFHIFRWIVLFLLFGYRSLVLPGKHITPVVMTWIFQDEYLSRPVTSSLSWALISHCCSNESRDGYPPPSILNPPFAMTGHPTPPREWGQSVLLQSLSGPFGVTRRSEHHNTASRILFRLWQFFHLAPISPSGRPCCIYIGSASNSHLPKM